ncbi:MAG: hypothetical protein E7458_07165 [Ruminococcaceae bacterium]|nr:hypothetical protein [Oscillospiraceae bacterium]
MQYPSSRCPGMTAIFALLFILLSAAAVLSVLFLDGVLRVLFPVMELAIAALFVWVLTGTRYTLAENALILQCGPIRDELPYREIKSVYKTRGHGFLMALDFDRLELNPGLDPTRGKIVLSPVREDEFIEELRKRCPELIVK